jgi:hypothetical protein
VKSRLVMFVHGLGGAGRDTWRLPGQNGFPELVASDRVLQQEADFVFFEYPTSLFRLPFTSRALGIRDLAEGLKPSWTSPMQNTSRSRSWLTVSGDLSSASMYSRR